MVEEYSLLLPYPEVSGSLPAKQLEILSDLYAGRFSKLTAVASYGYQLVVLEGENNLSELFKGVFTVEAVHIYVRDIVARFFNDIVFDTARGAYE